MARRFLLLPCLRLRLGQEGSSISALPKSSLLTESAPSVPRVWSRLTLHPMTQWRWLGGIYPVQFGCWGEHHLRGCGPARRLPRGCRAGSRSVRAALGPLGRPDRSLGLGCCPSHSSGGGGHSTRRRSTGWDICKVLRAECLPLHILRCPALPAMLGQGFRVDVHPPVVLSILVPRVVFALRHILPDLICSMEAFWPDAKQNGWLQKVTVVTEGGGVHLPVVSWNSSLLQREGLTRWCVGLRS